MESPTRSSLRHFPHDDDDESAALCMEELQLFYVTIVWRATHHLVWFIWFEFQNCGTQSSTALVVIFPVSGYSQHMTTCEFNMSEHLKSHKKQIQLILRMRGLFKSSTGSEHGFHDMK
jgi:hypothetical protein